MAHKFDELTIKSDLNILDTSNDHRYTIIVNELIADRTITLPLLTSNDTFVFEDHTQTLTGKTLDAYFYTSVYTVDMWNFMKRTMFMDLGAVPVEGLYAGETYEQKRDRLLELILQPITLPGLSEQKTEYAVLDQF